MGNELPGTNGQGDPAVPAGAKAPAGDAAPPEPGPAAPAPNDDPIRSDGAGLRRGGPVEGGEAGGAIALGRRSLLRKMTGWWRRHLGDNFSLEHELDAKIDRLRVLLSSLPESVAPGMDAALRARLLRQLDWAAQLLDACEPFERVMQRIAFVETEIMLRLEGEHIDLAIEALRAEVTISLPETAGKSMLDEIDKVASATDPLQRKVRILGLKARLSASVIELFRGSERARDAIQMLGAVLVALTCALAGLFYQEGSLQTALFTHYGSTVTLPARTEAGPPASTTTPPSPAPAPASAAQKIELIPDGPSRLIDFAFPVLVMAACFGGIGACLSGLFSFTLQGRVPNEYEGWFRTLIRPVIGIASGFLAVVILRSGLLTFGDDLAWVAIAALAFGFSERLFMGTMERLESLPK